jgi:hypothetical protein
MLHVPQDMNIYHDPGVYTLGRDGGKPISNAHNPRNKTHTNIM